MHDGVEAVELRAVGEDDGAKFAAVDAPAIGRNSRPERGDDFPVGGLAGFYQLVAERVGIQGR